MCLLFFWLCLSIPVSSPITRIEQQLPNELGFSGGVFSDFLELITIWLKLTRRSQFDNLAKINHNNLAKINEFVMSRQVCRCWVARASKVNDPSCYKSNFRY